MRSHPIEREALTIPEAALSAGVGVRYLRNEIREGRGPRVVPVGRRNKVRPAALRAWLQQKEVPSAAIAKADTPRLRRGRARAGERRRERSRKAAPA